MARSLDMAISLMRGDCHTGLMVDLVSGRAGSSATTWRESLSGAGGLLSAAEVELAWVVFLDSEAESFEGVLKKRPAAFPGSISEEPPIR